MNERAHIEEQLREVQAEVSSQWAAVKATGQELDRARAQYEASSDARERATLTGLIAELPWTIDKLDKEAQAAQVVVVGLQRKLRDLDTEADKLRALVAESSGLAGKWEERITQYRRERDGQLALMENERRKVLAAAVAAQERLQAIS